VDGAERATDVLTSVVGSPSSEAVFFQICTWDGVSLIPKDDIYISKCFPYVGMPYGVLTPLRQ
jgi:hypothetical protein